MIQIIASRGKGRFGNAFEFGEKSNTVIFFKSKRQHRLQILNIGLVLFFWLSVDLQKLDGYTDPIQITDASF
ncbi:hypothetical protein D5R40_32725 [Okeania hirsuta]|uniref:Uncharacterized protein n=1 Tax=Okeania hirsuta TaxID=1458930 RepID=A0A3N6P735_9CYAN|nr:hypothetical protein [Okeania hirsuta]RQH18930.1 hypothetical protein D5R40_32725 [Okeania hirsuta]